MLNDLDEASLQDAVVELDTSDGLVQGFPGDITDQDFAAGFVDFVLDVFGAVDIVVNNAGFTWDGGIQAMTDEQWNAVLDVHLTAPFRLLRRLAPVFRDQAQRDRDAGIWSYRKVVNVTSASGVYGIAGQANYASAKAGLDGLTRTLSREWGPHLVNVNSVALGLVETRLTRPTSNSFDVGERSMPVYMNEQRWQELQGRIPLGSRAATPEQAAGAIYLLCTPDADYVTGQTLLCTGGMAL